MGKKLIRIVGNFQIVGKKMKIVGNENQAELWVMKTFLGSHYPQLGYPQLFIFCKVFYPQFWIVTKSELWVIYLFAIMVRGSI